MRRIVRIIARLNVGGPARHVVWLTAGLPQDQWQSTLVTGVVPPGEADMNWFAAACGVEPLVIPEMSREISLHDAVAIWKTWRLLVRKRPDIVCTHTAKAGTAGRIAATLYRWLTPGSLIGRPRKCAVVHTYHGHIFHGYYGRAKTAFFLTIERMLSHVTDAIIVLSAQQLEEIHETFRVGRRGQFAIIPLGIELDVFRDWAAKRDVLRRELGASDDELLVGIVGRLTEIKNHELFLDVAAEWHRRRPAVKARFLIIGDGHRREHLESLAAGANLGELVQFLGNRTDPEVFYPGLDVVALTSRNEGTPLTIIEALANGRAVVATAVGGVRDLLGDHDERGVAVPPDDARAFCDALEQLARDPARREALGDAGEGYVRSRHDRHRLIRDIASLYQGLTAGQ